MTGIEQDVYASSRFSTRGLPKQKRLPALRDHFGQSIRLAIDAEPGRVYVDRETGEPLEVVAQLLPLAPTPSELPWSVENLRFCNWCDQLLQKDLNDCPTCGRRVAPERPAVED